MRFQHDEPLSPQEARAFLEVHAEREARGPRPSDLAETLGLSPDEARAILTEARNRVAARPGYDARLGIAGAATAVFLVLLAVSLFHRPAPALAIQTAEARSVPSFPPLTQTAQAAPTSTLVGKVPVNVPAGFDISIRVSGAQTDAAGSPTLTAADYRAMGGPETARVRDDLSEATLAMIDNALVNPEAWMRAPELWVNLRVRGGGWTLVKVPIKPFTLPLEGNLQGREDLRRTLLALYQAGWADVLRVASTASAQR